MFWHAFGNQCESKQTNECENVQHKHGVNYENI